MDSGDKPVVKETRTVTYPAGDPSPLEKPPQAKKAEPVGDDLAGISAKDVEVVKKLEALAISPNAGEYRIVILRKSPAVQGYFALACNRPLRDYDVGTLPDIRQYVADEFGGGNYELRLVRPTGGDVMLGSYEIVERMTFPIDILLFPPKADRYTTYGIAKAPVDPGFVTTQPLQPGQFGAPGQPNKPPMDPAANNLENKMLQRKNMDLDYEIWEKRNAMEDAKLQRDNQKRRMVREDESAETTRQLEWQTRLDSVRDRADERFATTMAAMAKQSQDMLAALAQRKEEDGAGMSSTMAMFMKMSMDQQTTTMALFKEMAEARREDSAKMAEIQAENQRNMVAMITAVQTQNIEQVRASAQESKVLTEKLISLRIESPDQRLAQVLEARDKGKAEAREWFQMIEEVRANAERDSEGGSELDWDPEAGVIGNVTALAFRGLQRLLTGPNAGAIAGIVNRILNKPATNTRFTDTEVAAAAQQMEPYLLSPGNNPNAPMLPPPIQHTRGFTAGQTLPSTSTTPTPGLGAPVPAVPVRPPVGQVWQTDVQHAVVAAAPVAAPPPQPVIEIVPTGEILPETQPVEAEMVPEGPSDRLRYHVNSMLEEAIADLVDQRHVHQWPFSAYETLNRNFLDGLARAANDTEKMTLIRQYADPNLFTQLSQIFWRPGGNESFRLFSQGLQQLIALHLEAVHAPTTSAVPVAQ